MKRSFKRILIIFMAIVMLFEVAMPPCVLKNSGINVVYAEEYDKKLVDEAIEALGTVGEHIRRLFEWAVHNIGGDFILQMVHDVLADLVSEEFANEFSYKKYIPKRTGWHVRKFNSTLNDTIDTALGSEIPIFYYNESGDVCFPSQDRHVGWNGLTSNIYSQTVFLTKGTVYYVPNYVYIDEMSEGVMRDLEVLFANLLYSLANGLHWLTCSALGKTITIDDLVFNKYPETNISYFKNSNNAGEEVSSLIYGTNGVGGLDSVINDWYRIFRNIALMGYMAILVYMGIRIMFGATAEKKADYKALFMNWVIGIAILLLFPYVMKYMIELNNALVKMIYDNKGYETRESAPMNNIDTSKDFSEISIDEEIDWSAGDDYMSQIGAAAYQSERIALSFAFLIMTWQFITLIFQYYKRLFMVAFLIIIFPLVALSYAIDKVADGKSQAFNTWAKEYMLAVFVQTFHAIIYVFVCSTVYSATGAAGAEFDYILIIVGVTFLSKGESIIRQIFSQVSGASSIKTLSQSAAGTFAKIKLAEGAIKTVGSYTFGEKNPINRLKNGVNNIRAFDAKLNAFDVTATKDEDYNIGVRLPNAPKMPKKPDVDASEEEKEKYEKNKEKYEKNKKYYQAAAVLNNPKTHSHEEMAMAQETLKKLAMEKPNHGAFKYSNILPGQLQAMVGLDRDVMMMVNEGRSTIDIERNVTARLGVVFPNENDEQIKQRVNTYLTDLFLTGGSVGGASKHSIKSNVEATINAINKENSEIKYKTSSMGRSFSNKDVDDLAEQAYEDVLDRYNIEDDNVPDDVKNEIKTLAKNVFVLNGRKSGDYTKAEILEAADYVRKNAYNDDINQEMVDNLLESDLDVDTLAHVIAKNDLNDKRSNKDSKHYKLASEIAKDYEDNPREDFFDDEISTHEIIKNMNNSDKIDEIINKVYENQNKESKEAVMEVAKEILADRKVDILEKSLDTNVPLQDGYTKEEVLGQKIVAVNNLLNDLSPLKTGSSASGLDQVAKFIINRKESERTNISKQINEKPWYKKAFNVITSDDTLKNADDVIKERKEKRDKIRNEHFTGDIFDDDKY